MVLVASLRRFEQQTEGKTCNSFSKIKLEIVSYTVRNININFNLLLCTVTGKRSNQWNMITIRMGKLGVQLFVCM